jgi:hypothetical protein
MSRMTESQIREALVDAYAIQTDGNYIYPEYKIKSPRYTTYDVGRCCMVNLRKWNPKVSGQSYAHCRTCGMSRHLTLELTNMGRTFCQAKIASIDGQVVG